MAEIEPLQDESELENLPDGTTYIEVNSVTEPITSRDGLRTIGYRHSSWSVLFYEDGEITGANEEEVFHSRLKEPAKEKARELAKRHAPAVIGFQNRDGEVFRAEKAVPEDDGKMEL